MLSAHENYRSYLRARLAEATAQNPKFSLRAFARKLGVGPSTLSEVLSGRKNLSREMALKISSRLGLGRRDTALFCDLVDLESARTPELKAVVLKRLSRPGKLGKKASIHPLSVDLFQLFGDWYHVPILEMIDGSIGGKSFDLSPQTIARRLGISPVEAAAALERLARLKMIERTPGGAWRKTHDATVTASSVPNEALRKFHRQMLEKAIASIGTQTPAEKKIGSETFAFDPEQLGAVDELMEEFFRKVTELAAKSTKRTEIYHLGVQFFNLTPKERI